MSFETTSSNTGFESGEYFLLEEMVGIDLLHYACCHHIIEIVVVKVLSVSDISSTGPDIYCSLSASSNSGSSKTTNSLKYLKIKSPIEKISSVSAGSKLPLSNYMTIIGSS